MELPTVTEQCVVALTWVLKDTLGEELDVLDDPVEFLVGGGDLLPRITEALQGHAVGDTVALHLEPHDAFGDFDENLIFLERRDLFPAETAEGMAFEGLPAGCAADAPRDRLYVVTDLYPDHLVLDANHPLAGIALRVALRIHAIREATEGEVGSGTAGAGFFRIPSPDGGHLH